jgi:LmbE family N-acetylglucosaminyl deacetylase
MRILAVGAHPDDLEILCGGTLARFHLEGHEVVMSYATRGELGNDDLTLKECFETRSREAQLAARIVEAELKPLGFDDNGVNPHDRAQQVRVLDLIREAKPDLILTHDPADYHPDHRAVSALVSWCVPLIAIRRYQTKYPPLDSVPTIYFMDTMLGVNFSPGEYVDISQVIEMKLSMLRAHASQLVFLKRYFSLDPLEQVSVAARYRGMQAGVGYAEAFRQCSDYGHGIRTRRWLP